MFLFLFIVDASSQRMQKLFCTQLRKMTCIFRKYICIDWMIYSGRFKGGSRGLNPPPPLELHYFNFMENLNSFCLKLGKRTLLFVHLTTLFRNPGSVPDLIVYTAARCSEIFTRREPEIRRNNPLFFLSQIVSTGRAWL